MESKIRIEVLFPEIANLYGDLANIEYLKKSYPELEVVETHLIGEPEFMKRVPSLIYMGTLTENGQRLATEKLSHYKEKLAEMMLVRNLLGKLERFLMKTTLLGKWAN